jgi:hypothetical protein
MRKLTFNQTKQILAILLVVLFVATVTAPAISADKSQQSSSGLQTFSTEQLAKQHCPTAASRAATITSNGLEDITLNRSIWTFLIVMFSFSP